MMRLLTGPNTVATTRKKTRLNRIDSSNQKRPNAFSTRITTREKTKTSVAVVREYRRLFLRITPMSRRSYLKRPTPKTIRGKKLNDPGG